MRKLTKEAIKKYLEERDETAEGLLIAIEDRDGDACDFFAGMLANLLLPQEIHEEGLRILEVIASKEKLK